MNRKLINGLLLLTVTTGGVGMFTSCKDNEDGFKNEILTQQSDLIKILDKKIEDLKKQIDEGDFTGPAGPQGPQGPQGPTGPQGPAGSDGTGSTADLTQVWNDLKVVREKLNALLNAGLLTTDNQEYLEDLIKNNSNYIAGLKTYVDDMVVSLITSVEIQDVYNPAFGSVNLPFGVQSTILTNYYYQSNHAVKFPQVDDASLVYGEKEAQQALDDAIIEGKITPKTTESFGTEIQNIDRLGEVYVTINPSTVPQEAIDGLQVKLVKSNGESVLGEFKAVKENDHVINFGYTRAGQQNGFYKIAIKADAKDVPSIALTLDEGLKDALRDLSKKPSKSDLLAVGEAVIKQFNNRIPALALELTSEVPTTFKYQSTPWNPTPGGLLLGDITMTEDENGNLIFTGNKGADQSGTKGEATNVDVNGNPILRSLYTKYALAAVTYHPLAYSFDPEGYVPNRRLPQIGHIQQYVNKVLDKINFSLDLGINPDDYKFDINLSDVEFKIDKTSITINLEGTPVYKADKDGNPLPGAENIVGVLGPEANIVLGYDPEKQHVEGADETALNPLLDQIVKAINGEGGFTDQIQTKIEEDLISQVDKLVKDLNNQLLQVDNKITDQIQSIKDKINNELNGKLGDGINKLIDLYNGLAKKINNILDDPNAYLQVYAAFRNSDGSLHHFSNVASDPSVFTMAGGEAIEMFLTSYNAELLAPAYKKYVAVVEDLTDGSDVAGINEKGEYLNTVLEGRQQRVYLPVGGSNGLQKGHTYKVVYTALDYRGYISARNFYVRVK